MIKNATIFRHTLDNSLAGIEPILGKRGIAITVVDTFADSLDGFDPLTPDLLIVLGGSCGVYQSNLYPFLTTELAILKDRLAADKPTLGICLGAQLIAAALGNQVYKGAQGREIGWLPVTVNEAGQKTPVRHFDAALTRIMHWHGDTFDLPDEATLLASSALYPNQIFQVGQRIIGFQCHIEVDRKTVRSWLVGEAYDADKGLIDLYRLEKDTDLYAGIMAGQTEKFMNEWLDQAG